MLALLMTSLAFATAPLKVVNFDNVKVTFYVGDVTTQDLAILAASHPADRVITQGGIAGAITRAGAGASLEAFKVIMQRAGRLPYGSVHAVPLPFRSDLRAVILFNVITLDPLSELRFERVDQLNASSFPFRPEERALYRDLLEHHEIAVAAAKPSEHFVHHHHPFRKRREDLLQPYAVGLGFTHVTHAVTNMLDQIKDLDRFGVSVGPLGNGRSGPLTTKRSIEAVLAGAKAFVFTRGNPERSYEIRYVIPGEDAVDARAAITGWIDAALEDGRFLTTAGEYQVSGTDWEAARADFRAREEEKAVITPAPPLRLRAAKACARAIDRLKTGLSSMRR